jgi:hypothetical protein
LEEYGGDDGGEAKGDDKVNLVIEDGDKVNLNIVLHKEIFNPINNYFFFFFFGFKFLFNKKMGFAIAR